MSKKMDRKRVFRALDASLQRAFKYEQEQGELVIDLATARTIIFSDLHKATRQGNDDFRASERAYNAALAFYNALDFTLVTLGDVEELWEERADPVIEQYYRTLELEAQFHKDGRYLRFWGNHDDDWRYPGRVEDLLWPIYGPGLLVHEGLVFRVKDGETIIGTMLLVHGHQGTLDSDDLRPIARPVVRYIWRPIQRLIRMPSTTPAKDWRLRQDHNAALYDWSVNQHKLVLVAGHTHRPIFQSYSHEDQIQHEIQELREKLATDPENSELIERLGDLSAELEWVRAQMNQPAGIGDFVPQLKPSYFNSGCCCFPDGDVTGLEILGGEIRLVRWPNDEGEPRRTVLARTKLVNVFAQL